MANRNFDDSVHRGHSCKKCGKNFGEQEFTNFLTSIGNTYVPCPSCNISHEFDDDKAKSVQTLIFLISFFGFASLFAYLFFYQWRQAGTVFYIQLVLPVIIGYIAAVTLIKIYQWKVLSLSLYGE